jgi:hypothetical protein
MVIVGWAGGARPFWTGSPAHPTFKSVNYLIRDPKKPGC